MSNLKIPSFEEVLANDGKAEDLELIKIEKQSQLDTQVRTIEVKIARARKLFAKSVIDPKIDTLAIASELKILTAELELAKEIREAVFPKN